MRKRGFADHFSFGHFDNDPSGSDASAGVWNVIVAPTIGGGDLRPGIGLDIASVVSEGHPAAVSLRDRGSSDDAVSDGPDGAAAGGKKATGGGTTASSGGTTTSGGGTTSATGSGGTTSGTGTTTTVGQGTTTTVLHDIAIHWQALEAPTGDSGVPTDTYFSQQWGLASKTAGINVTSAWQNYTGAGVKIGVIDDGFDYNHTDLKPHYLLNLDYDSRTGGTDAFGDATADKHGTTVMGVIGAARDGTGSVGVAYDAGITGFRIGYGANGAANQIADAFNHALTSGMDVVNASWGYTAAYSDNFFSSGYATSKNAIQNDVAYGRGGLGINIVFAAGNARGSGDDVNYHNFQNDPYVITVGATDSYGHVASFSSPGAALLISAPGTAKTDDRTGTDGYTTSDYINMSGTSYAAPYISGVVALMLQANPGLGFWDLQEILAYSAKNTDPTSAGWHTNGASNWNGGGLHFSSDYGFGMVDATAAVRLSESWQYQSTYANMSTESASHTDNAGIPDGTGSLQSQITFASSLDVNKMVIDLNITHPHVSDLTVTLTSPNGTSAVLVSHPAGGTGSGIVFETTANNFWGEDAKGVWTLSVTDDVTGNVGTLNSWTLTALGDSPNTPTTYVYTDEFAGVTGANNSVLTDASGSATINTASVTTGSYLDLHARALDTIAGKSLLIGASTIIKNVWAGDGNDTIIANDFGNTIQGGRGNDTIVAGAGTDKIYGGLGADTFVFNSMNTTTDVIGDFTSGQDAIDLHVLLMTIGYSGTNPLADKWINLVSDGTGGTSVQIDAHNGQAAVTIIDLAGVQPNALHQGANYGLLVA
jgi:subtilisin-like proprotein convertase family protein